MKNEKQFHGEYWQGKSKKQLSDSAGFFLIAVLASMLVILLIIWIIGRLSG